MSDRHIAFLHAFPCTGEMWAPQMEAVRSAGWTAVAPDLPGFGAAALPDAEPTLDVVADLVLEQLVHAYDGPWTVAGVSLGGYVAMNLMRRHPECLDAVLLCDTKATADGSDARINRERLAAMCEDPNVDVARILEQAVLPGLAGATTHESRPEVVTRIRRWLAAADGRSIAWYQRAMAARPDSLAVLEGFPHPALVLWGEEDALSPESEQAMMVDALSASTEVVVPAAGHLANVESPDVVSAAVVDFLLARDET